MEIAGEPVLGIEVALVAAGVLCWVGALVRGSVHRWWSAPQQLPPWPISGSDFALFVLLFLSLYSLAPIAVARVLGQDLSDLDPGEMLVQGYATQASILAAWALFRLHPAAETPRGRTGLAAAVGTGLTAFLFLIPALMATIGGWYWLLEVAGLDPQPQDVIEIIQAAPPSERLYWVLLAVVVAPVCEELVFRGYVFRFFHQRMPLLPAAIISGAVFASAHFNLLTFLPLLLLGAVLGILYAKTGRLAASIALHMVFNLNTVIVVLLGGAA